MAHFSLHETSYSSFRFNIFVAAMRLALAFHAILFRSTTSSCGMRTPPPYRGRASALPGAHARAMQLHANGTLSCNCKSDSLKYAGPNLLACGLRNEWQHALIVDTIVKRPDYRKRCTCRRLSCHVEECLMAVARGPVAAPDARTGYNPYVLPVPRQPMNFPRSPATISHCARS